jgi:hypothetical protein
MSAALGDLVAVDWDTYESAVRRWMAGQPIYADAQLVGPYDLVGVVRDGYAYPPPSLLFFSPLVLIPFGGVAWIAANVVLLVWGMAAVVRRELGFGDPWMPVLAVLVLSLDMSFAEGALVGNPNVGLAGILALAWARGPGRGAWGGVAGLLALVKVTQATLFAWSTRPVRAAMIASAVCGGVSLVTLPLFGLAAWGDFATALANSRPHCADSGIYPYSVACQLTPALGVGAAKLAGIGIAVLLTILAIAVRARPFLAFVLVGLAWLAPVTDLHSHYRLYLLVLAWVLVWHVAGRVIDRGAWRPRSSSASLRCRT